MMRPVITGDELETIGALIHERSGIRLDDAGPWLPARVLEHMAVARVADGADLLRHVRHSRTEYEGLLDRLLWYESAFFRFPQAFQAFEQHVLPEIHMTKFWENPRSLRVWSAGCGNGEEPYSIAISVSETLELTEAWSVSILATDISGRALQHAERGVYEPQQVAALSARQHETYFSRIGGQFMAKPRLRHLVSFALENLADRAYAGRFDCIFCMDVLRYFGASRRTELLRHFYDCLEPGGYLLLGDGEQLGDDAPYLQSIEAGGARVWQKPLGPAGKLSVRICSPVKMRLASSSI